MHHPSTRPPRPLPAASHRQANRRIEREFKKEILNETARCLNMPFNIAAGNSSGYNYASGRLDHQTYFKSIRVEQADLGAVVLARNLGAWMQETTRVLSLRLVLLRNRRSGRQ